MENNTKILILNNAEENNIAQNWTEKLSNSLKGAFRLKEESNILIEKNVQHADNVDRLIIIAFANEDGNLYPFNEEIQKIILSNKEKALAILPSPIIINNIPSYLLNLPLFTFFDYELNANRLRPYLTDGDIQSSRLYWLKIIDLAIELISKKNSNNLQIFLAPTTGEMTEFYDAIHRDLYGYDINTLPKNILTNNLNNQITRIKEALENSTIRVIIPGNTNLKFEAQQIINFNKLIEIIAENDAQNTNKQNYIWLSPQLKLSDENTKRLVEALKRGEGHIKGEVLQMPFEEFKKVVYKAHLKINALNENQNTTNDKKTIYVIHEPKKTQTLKQICDFIKQKGFKDIYIDYAISNKNYFEQHRNNLLTADGIVVIDNECPEDWVKGKLKDMMKAPGYGRQQAIRAKTLITSDYEKYKSLEDRGNVFLVDASKPFEESLDRFFNELKIRL